LEGRLVDAHNEQVVGRRRGGTQAVSQIQGAVLQSPAQFEKAEERQDSQDSQGDNEAAAAGRLCPRRHGSDVRILFSEKWTMTLLYENAGKSEVQNISNGKWPGSQESHPRFLNTALYRR
jgi:hypothetical protein